MSFNRTNEKETYNITSEWLSDFTNDFSRQAQSMDYLKDYMNSRFKDKKVFSTIEEKIADMRDRVGLALMTTGAEEFEDKTASKNMTEKIAHDKKDIERMTNVLSYIKQIVDSEPYLDYVSIVQKCKDEEGLKFSELQIDMAKLKSFIDKKIKEKDNKETVNTVSYKPRDMSNSLRDGDNQDDKMADYYRHATPPK